MIVKEYFQNINTRAPKNYFERWYADVWRRFINASIAPPNIVDKLLSQELAKVGATLTHKDNGYRFVVTFEKDEDYTWFVLRWS